MTIAIGQEAEPSRRSILLDSTPVSSTLYLYGPIVSATFRF
jgi:hypothetical protein